MDDLLVEIQGYTHHEEVLFLDLYLNEMQMGSTMEQILNTPNIDNLAIYLSRDDELIYLWELPGGPTAEELLNVFDKIKEYT